MSRRKVYERVERPPHVVGGVRGSEDHSFVGEDVFEAEGPHAEGEQEDPE
ncbi:MAG: hypothetical protein JRG89_03350 [Deltaproteobacteria bacterium]|nr:hypothetical protein [Deltaproteobacteria bacterium]